MEDETLVIQGERRRAGRLDLIEVAGELVERRGEGRLRIDTGLLQHLLVGEEADQTVRPRRHTVGRPLTGNEPLGRRLPSEDAGAVLVGDVRVEWFEVLL